MENETVKERIKGHFINNELSLTELQVSSQTFATRCAQQCILYKSSREFVSSTFSRTYVVAAEFVEQIDARLRQTTAIQQKKKKKYEKTVADFGMRAVKHNCALLQRINNAI